MANEQLRRDRKDLLAEGVEGAGRDDCLHAPATTPQAGGLLQLPSVRRSAPSTASVRAMSAIAIRDDPMICPDAPAARRPAYSRAIV